jgi:hypothetical protein
VEIEVSKLLEIRYFGLFKRVKSDLCVLYDLVWI